jgi:hypothetical protein
MQDNDILGNIHALVEEEHRLRDGEAVDPARLREVEEQLDQCWDLLRQRRSRRQYGEDPDSAKVRPADVVEHYEQ